MDVRAAVARYWNRQLERCRSNLSLSDCRSPSDAIVHQIRAMWTKEGNKVLLVKVDWHLAHYGSSGSHSIRHDNSVLQERVVDNRSIWMAYTNNGT